MFPWPEWLFCYYLQPLISIVHCIGLWKDYAFPLFLVPLVLSPECALSFTFHCNLLFLSQLHHQTGLVCSTVIWMKICNKDVQHFLPRGFLEGLHFPCLNYFGITGASVSKAVWDIEKLLEAFLWTWVHLTEWNFWSPKWCYLDMICHVATLLVSVGRWAIFISLCRGLLINILCLLNSQAMFNHETQNIPLHFKKFMELQKSIYCS